MEDKLQNDKTDKLFRMVSLQDDEEAFRSLFYNFFAPLCVFANKYIEENHVKILSKRPFTEFGKTEKNCIYKPLHAIFLSQAFEMRVLICSDDKTLKKDG